MKRQQKVNSFRVGAFFLVMLLIVVVGYNAMLMRDILPYGVQQPRQPRLEGGYFCVRVLDKASGTPVVNAYVQLDWHWTGTGYDYAMYTDGKGEASKAVLYGNYDVKINHQNYETLMSGPHSIASRGETWFAFELTPYSGNGNGETITVDIYLVDPYKTRVYTGFLIFGGEEHPVGDQGKITLYHLAKGSSVVWQIKGQYNVDFWTWVQFDFFATVQLPQVDSVYTVWVGSQVVENAAPPAPPPNIWNLLQLLLNWITQYWWVVVLLIVVVFVLPYLVYFLRLIRPPRQFV